MWFWSNDLQLNPVQSAASFFETSQRLKKSNLPKSVTDIACCKCSRDQMAEDTRRNHRQHELDFEDHVNGVVRTCNYHQRFYAVFGSRLRATLQIILRVALSAREWTIATPYYSKPMTNLYFQAPAYVE